MSTEEGLGLNKQRTHLPKRLEQEIEIEIDVFLGILMGDLRNFH